MSLSSPLPWLVSHLFLSGWIHEYSVHAWGPLTPLTLSPSIFQLFLTSWFSSSSCPSPTTSHPCQDSVPFAGWHYQKPSSAARWIVTFYWEAPRTSTRYQDGVCFCLTWGQPGGFAHRPRVGFSVAQLPCPWDGDPRDTRLTGLLWGCRKEALLLSPWGLAQSEHLTDARSSPVASWPRACPGGSAAAAGCCLSSPLIRLFFSICPKEALAGTLKQEEEKGASCPLSPASRGWSWPGEHRDGGSRVHRSMVVGDVFFVRWSEVPSLLGKSAQWVAGRVCAGHP